MKWSDEVGGTGATAPYGKEGCYFVFHKDTAPKAAWFANLEAIVALGKPWCWVAAKSSDGGMYIVLDAGPAVTREKAIAGAEACQKALAHEAQEVIKLTRKVLAKTTDEAKREKLRKRPDDLLAAHPEFGRSPGVRQTP
jgi:hypothetical protein